MCFKRLEEPGEEGIMVELRQDMPYEQVCVGGGTAGEEGGLPAKHCTAQGVGIGLHCCLFGVPRHPMGTGGDNSMFWPKRLQA